MRSVRARGAVDLAQVVGLGDPLQLAVQAVRYDGQFLAEGGRRGRLAMRAGQHGNLTVRFRHGLDLLHQSLGIGKPDVLHGTLDAYGVGEVVDVLGRATEVHHRGKVFNPDFGKAPANVVLDRLNVVHGDGFDLCQLVDGCCIEAGDDGPELGYLLVGEGSGAGEYRLAGEVDEPLNFDVNAVAVQGRLGQVIDEGRDGGTVAAIKGTKGEGFGSEGHAGGFSHGAHSFMFCGRSRVGDTAYVEAHGVFHIALVSASGPPQRLRSVKSTDHHHNKME